MGPSHQLEEGEELRFVEKTAEGEGDDVRAVHELEQLGREQLRRGPADQSRKRNIVEAGSGYDDRRLLILMPQGEKAEIAILHGLAPSLEQTGYSSPRFLMVGRVVIGPQERLDKLDDKGAQAAQCNAEILMQSPAGPQKTALSEVIPPSAMSHPLGVCPVRAFSLFREGFGTGRCGCIDARRSSHPTAPVPARPAVRVRGPTIWLDTIET